MDRLVQSLNDSLASQNAGVNNMSPLVDPQCPPSVLLLDGVADINEFAIFKEKEVVTMGKLTISSNSFVVVKSADRTTLVFLVSAMPNSFFINGLECSSALWDGLFGRWLDRSQPDWGLRGIPKAVTTKRQGHGTGFPKPSIVSPAPIRSSTIIINLNHNQRHNLHDFHILPIVHNITAAYFPYRPGLLGLYPPLSCILPCFEPKTDVPLDLHLPWLAPDPHVPICIASNQFTRLSTPLTLYATTTSLLDQISSPYASPRGNTSDPLVICPLAFSR
ncbi:hypothetical protein KCU88_g209, partial [Aureobasidium melanogenum]